MLTGMLAALTAALTQLRLLVSYITSSNAFPQPLSEEEEQHYLALMEQGSQEARHVLIERNLRLVAHVAKKFENTGESFDDLISIGTIGLIKAIGTYNHSRNTKLATYAARCIENEILMHLRSTKKNRAEVFLYDPIGVDKEGNEIALIDILGTDPDSIPDSIDLQFEQERLLSRMCKLRQQERKVIELRYGLNNGTRKTQREIARALGISRSYVSRIEKRAITKLLKEMTADGSQG